MATTISFSSAYFRTIGVALEEGTKKVRLNCTASLTKEVRDKMEWAEPQKPKGNGRTIDDAATCLDLEGELHAQTMEVTPNDREVSKHAFQVDIALVSKFQLVTVDLGDNKRRRELRFQILTTAKGAAGIVEGYADRLGQAPATMKISYSKQEQMDLETTAEHRAAVSEDNG